MTKSSEQTAPAKSSPDPAAEPAGEARRMTRRGWTLVVSGTLFLVFVVLGSVVPVPFVAISPGPTYDTLGRDAAGNPVIQVTGHQTYPTTGELRMTTVSLHDGVTLFQGLGFWASGRYALAPREEYFKPGETNEQVKQENIQQLQDSQSNAQVAALRKLGYPVKVLAKQIVSGSPADHVLSPGDKLITVNGKKIAEAADVRAALAGTLPGQTQPTQVPAMTIALQIARNLQKGVNRFDIRLDPAEMGRIDVRMEVSRDGAVAAHLTVEKPETLTLLQRDAGSLQQALSDSGLQANPDSLSFSLRDQNAGGNAQGSNAGGASISPPAAAATEETVVSPVYNVNLSATGGVDIRI